MEKKRRTRADAHLEGALQQMKDMKFELPINATDVLRYVASDIEILNALMGERRAFRIRKRYTDHLPEIDRLIYSGNKTIIIWKDGDKTIVSCGEGEQFDQYTGFCAAIVKKIFGSTTAAKKVMNILRKDCNK